MATFERVSSDAVPSVASAPSTVDRKLAKYPEVSGLATRATISATLAGLLPSKYRWGPTGAGGRSGLGERTSPGHAAGTPRLATSFALPAPFGPVTVTSSAANAVQ